MNITREFNLSEKCKKAINKELNLNIWELLPKEKQNDFVPGYYTIKCNEIYFKNKKIILVNIISYDPMCEFIDKHAKFSFNLETKKPTKKSEIQTQLSDEVINMLLEETTLKFDSDIEEEPEPIKRGRGRPKLPVEEVLRRTEEKEQKRLAREAKKAKQEAKKQNKKVYTPRPTDEDKKQANREYYEKYKASGKNIWYCKECDEEMQRYSKSKHLTRTRHMLNKEKYKLNEEVKHQQNVSNQAFNLFKYLVDELNEINKKNQESQATEPTD